MGKKQVGRSAISGRFVNKNTVKKNPKTTVTQTVRTGSRKPKRSK
jgi:hypothetical protein